VRYANADPGRVPALVDEVIALRPDVLVGFESVVRIMKTKTSTIPIVLTNSSDPVGLGLARPGGNVTGVSMLWELMPPKVLELLKEILPRLSRVGVIIDTTSPGSKLVEQNARKAAAALGLSIVLYPAASRADLVQAMARMEKDRIGALTTGGPAPTLLSHLDLVIAEATRMRLALVFWDRGKPCRPPSSRSGRACRRRTATRRASWTGF